MRLPRAEHGELHGLFHHFEQHALDEVEALLRGQAGNDGEDGRARVFPESELLLKRGLA